MRNPTRPTRLRCTALACLLLSGLTAGCANQPLSVDVENGSPFDVNASGLSTDQVLVGGRPVGVLISGMGVVIGTVAGVANYSAGGGTEFWGFMGAGASGAVVGWLIAVGIRMFFYWLNYT